ncbi:hypothetical protein [Burkholderia pseudomallei]|jgi:hypothetical protein|uniref:hypothetical protein n=1 Tax=Burkholderia pseudomallei TaxID=28450 RepID=UPI0024DFB443|nr:hypothetical protein [Burkholderia pseudomallei]
MAIKVTKGRNVMSKGIALCHVEQGYSANKRAVSLLMKSNVESKEMTTEIVKGLRQVSVEISMEEFLRRFFYIYGDDAALLAKMMGFQTQLEYEAEENPTDEWLQDYNKRVQEELDERLESITVLKKAHSGEELDALEQWAVLKAQVEFEDGVAKNNIVFKEAEAGTKPEVEVEKTTVITLDPVTVITDSGASSSEDTVVKSNKETPVDLSSILKSDEFQALLKSQIEAETVHLRQEADTAKAEAAALKKAAEDVQLQSLIAKTAELSFVDEADRTGVATFLLKAENPLVASLLEKAQKSITALNEQLVAKTAEFDKFKEEYGAEIGQDGKVVVKGAEDAEGDQARLDEIIQARIAKANAGK